MRNNLCCSSLQVCVRQQSLAHTFSTPATNYSKTRTEPPAICSIPSHHTANRSSELSESDFEVIISMSIIHYLATLGIILKVFGCHLSDKAWRQFSFQETMSCFVLPSFSLVGQVGTGIRYLSTDTPSAVRSLCLLCSLGTFKGLISVLGKNCLY